MIIIIFKRDILPIKKFKWLNKYYPKYCSFISSTLTQRNIITQNDKDLPKWAVSKNEPSMADSISIALRICRKEKKNGQKRKSVWNKKVIKKIALLTFSLLKTFCYESELAPLYNWNTKLIVF